MNRRRVSPPYQSRTFPFRTGLAKKVWIMAGLVVVI
jgi:hypothetical protein